MPRLSFTLRDVFWLTLVVGMGVGWWMQWKRFVASEKTRGIWENRAHTLKAELVQMGVETEFENDGVIITGWESEGARTAKTRE